jgi:hypothetical protein
MSNIFFSVPVVGSLKSHEGWHRGDDKGYVFYMFRYHFFAKSRDSDLAPKMGERFREFSSPTGETTRIIESIKGKQTSTDLEKSLTHYFGQSENLHKVSGLAAAKVGFMGTGNARAEIKAEISNNISEAFKDDKMLARAIYTEEEYELTIERNISSNFSKSYVVPAFYKQKCLDVFLSHVDYLFVKYERKRFQISKKRIKLPVAIGNDRKQHPNIVKMNSVPVFCLKYWNPLRNSRWIDESQYKLEVEDPDEVAIHAAERTHQGWVSYPEVPTLYALSEIAFPRRYEEARLNTAA